MVTLVKYEINYHNLFYQAILMRYTSVFALSIRHVWYTD